MKRWWKIVFAHKHSVDCVILTGTNHRFVYYETYWRMMNRTFCVSLSIDNVSCGFDLIQFPMGILHLWESVGILIHSYGTVSIRFFLDSQLVLVMKNRFDKKRGWLGNVMSSLKRISYIIRGGLEIIHWLWRLGKEAKQFLISKKSYGIWRSSIVLFECHTK